MDKLQRQLRQFAESRAWEAFNSSKDFPSALNAEVAELVERFQRLAQDQGVVQDPEKRARIREKAGELLTCLGRLSDKLAGSPAPTGGDAPGLNAQPLPSDAPPPGNTLKREER